MSHVELCHAPVMQAQMGWLPAKANQLLGCAAPFPGSMYLCVGCYRQFPEPSVSCVHEAVPCRGMHD